MVWLRACLSRLFDVQEEIACAVTLCLLRARLLACKQALGRRMLALSTFVEVIMHACFAHMAGWGVLSASESASFSAHTKHADTVTVVEGPIWQLSTLHLPAHEPRINTRKLKTITWRTSHSSCSHPAAVIPLSFIRHAFCYSGTRQWRRCYGLSRRQCCDSQHGRH